MSKVDFLVKNGKVYTPEGFRDLDVGIKGEKIVFVAAHGVIQEAVKTIDAAGKHVLPGIIDPHTHVRDPGMTHKEDYETASMAAAAGGVTMFYPQPNTDPVFNTVETYQDQIDIGESKSLIDFNPPPSPLLYQDGWVPKLAAMGPAGFKIFQKVTDYPYSTPAGTRDTAVILEAFEEIAKTGKWCLVHPFDHNFLDQAQRKAKETGDDFTPSTLAKFYKMEEEFVSGGYSIYYLAKRAGLRWFAGHLPFYSGIDLVRWAKTENAIDVLSCCDNCWLTILPQEEMVYDVGPGQFVKRMQPAPSEEWLDKLWGAINDNTMEMIATDHAPHLRGEAAPGPLLEWYGHLLLNEVNKGKTTLERLVEITSVNAAKRLFGFYPRKGAIQPGSDADIILCDMEKEWTIGSDKVYTKSQINPYHGKKIKGQVTLTMLRGTIIMENGKVIGKPGYGKFIPVH